MAVAGLPSHLMEEVEGWGREGWLGGGVNFSSSRKDLHCLSDSRPGGCWRAFLREASGYTASLDGECAGEKPTLLLPGWFE